MNSDWGLLAAPFAAGLLVLATHVPLGIDVLRRGIIFLDLAVAQMAALGVLTAEMLGWDSGAGVQVAAAAAAVFGALLLTWTERRWPQLQEALIGLLFVVAASAGILLLANNPHGGEHLRDLLGGQILWIGWSQLLPVALLYAALLAVWFFVGRERLGRAGFYLVFALAVTASVQLVGVFLVFASLIAPAVATAALRRRLMMAWGLGTLGYAAGFLVSLLGDLPTGAAIVCCLGLVALAALLWRGAITQ
jgi:zinc/manganese transport system permease protein